MTNCPTMDFLKRLCVAIAKHFGPDCEVVVHDLSKENIENSIVAIENGHVTTRKIGDGPSHVVLEALNANHADLKDHLCYLTKTADGKILRSSTVYIKDEDGQATAILSINQDISKLIMLDNFIHSMVSAEQTAEEPEKIPTSVNDLLDDLIEQSVRLVGKPPVLMNKEERVKAIRFLNSCGAFLITKSSDKVAKYFNISKFTLYSYIDGKNAEEG